MAVMFGTDAIRGEFSARSFPAPDARALSPARNLSAFQTPGRDHSFIVAPVLSMEGAGNAPSGACILYAAYAIDADAIDAWKNKGYIGEGDVFTLLSDARAAAAQRNDAALRDLHDQARRAAGGDGCFEWTQTPLADRYAALETQSGATVAKEPAACRLTQRLLRVGSP